MPSYGNGHACGELAVIEREGGFTPVGGRFSIWFRSLLFGARSPTVELAWIDSASGKPKAIGQLTGSPRGENTEGLSSFLLTTDKEELKGVVQVSTDDGRCLSPNFNAAAYAAVCQHEYDKAFALYEEMDRKDCFEVSLGKVGSRSSCSADVSVSKLWHDAAQWQFLLDCGRLPADPWAGRVAALSRVAEHMEDIVGAGRASLYNTSARNHMPLCIFTQSSPWNDELGDDARILEELLNVRIPPPPASLTKPAIKPALKFTSIRQGFWSKGIAVIKPLFTPEALPAFRDQLLATSLDVQVRPLSAPVTEPLINPALDFTAIRHEFWSKGIAVIDDLFTPEALLAFRGQLLATRYTKLRREYLEATAPTFAPEALFHLARTFEEKLPDIFQGITLDRWWAFKHLGVSSVTDSDMNKGVALHADPGTVTINLFATPDSSRIRGGGLQVWQVMPDDALEPQQYNKHDWAEAEMRHIKSYPLVDVPYKYNRAALFMSDMYHQTEDYRFKKGFEHERVNLAVIFGPKQPRGTLFRARPKEFANATLPHAGRSEL